MISYLKKYPELVLILGATAIIAGLFLAWHVPDAQRREKALAREPQQISLQKLATDGFGDNPHIVVTDFTCGSGYAYEIQGRRGRYVQDHDTVGYGRAWIPLFPKSPAEKPDAVSEPKQFVVLLETTKTTTSGKGFVMLSRRASIPGVVEPYSRNGLESEIRAFLKESYPDTDFDNCLVIKEYDPKLKDSALFPVTMIIALAAGGVLLGLLVLAVGLWLLRRRYLMRHTTTLVKKIRR